MIEGFRLPERFTEEIPPGPAVGTKKLRLIDRAESPVFISPFINKDQDCLHCGATYGPVTYQQGNATLAHHYHRGLGNGGIFFYWDPTGSNLSRYRTGYLEAPDYAWFARLTPVGADLSIGFEGETASAPGVLVRDIYARYVVHEDEETSLYLYPESGLVFHDEYAGLLPVGEEHAGIMQSQLKGSFKFRFHKSPSGILFSSL